MIQKLVGMVYTCVCERENYKNSLHLNSQMIFWGKLISCHF